MSWLVSYSIIFFKATATATATALICCLHFSIIAGSSSKGDRLSLLDIKGRVTDDPLGVTTSWNDTLHFCKWYGVTCTSHGARQRVVALDLQSAKLTGTLSPSVGNLSSLTLLYLQNNSFGGTIPSKIGHLNKLQSLHLFNNSFAGEIPANLSACSHLTELDLSNNKLVGKIPPELGELLHLKVLALAINNLTGEIPTFLGNLSSLSHLHLGRNNLVGTIPDSLGNLQSLIKLSLVMNKLSGRFPPSVFNISSMTSFDIGLNGLEGSLPSDMSIMLPRLRYFSVDGNHFTGTIPTSISNCTHLRLLQLNLNNFRGQVPSLKKLKRLQGFSVDSNSLGTGGDDDDLDFVSTLANATMLGIFDISENNFKGTFPRIICNFTMLSYLGLEYNQIDGHVPDCIGNLVNLQFFTATVNKLSGAIPQGLGMLQNLNGLYLDSNKLSGGIPSSIGNLTLLTYVDLGGNNLEGQIPLSLGNCGNLLALELSDNRLSGNIPSQILRVSGLSILLNLSYNQLNGSLPAEVGELNKLDVLDVSGNKLSGGIPSNLGTCIGLETLKMGRNLFRGTIPEALKTLKGLRVLDLSQNHLSGKIPTFLAGLQLQGLNISYNDLEGEVLVSGVFNNASGAVLVGNRRLCGGISELKLPQCSSSSKIQRRSARHKMKIVTAILCSFAGVTLLLSLSLLYIFCYRQRKTKQAASADFGKFPKLSYQSLLKATDGFSEENLLGSGAFGSVYKAALDEIRTLVAVKVFNLERRESSKSFMAECEVLRSIRHRNLVKVLTACSSVDHRGNDFKALVYEFMVNGSLDDWLHPKSNNTTLALSLCQRLDIAIDVASALEYLHHYYSGVSVVHCDLKPSNVLLDDELVAHVSDFGLAKFLSEGVITTQADQTSLSGVRGTIGYTPPEYGLGNELSTFGDVYSFGILLLEMFTGKRPTDELLKEGTSLHDFVSAALPEQLIQILDPPLLEEMDNEEPYCNATKEVVVSILKIALSCATQLPRERPGMSGVVANLSTVRNELLETVEQLKY